MTTIDQLRREWAAMTDEQRRVAVAVCAGWTNIHDNDYATCDITEVGCKFRGDYRDRNDSALPEFTTDLNAIAQAVAAMTKDRYRAYLKRLVEIVLNTGFLTGYTSLALWVVEKIEKATALQRCEAYWMAMKETP